LTDTKKYLGRKDYLFFALAAFANASLFGLMQGYLLVFYVMVWGIPALTAGSMFAIIKIIDGFTDPFMGVIVDKTNTKWGKMRPYLIFGAPFMGLLVIICFIPFQFGDTMKIVYMYASYFLAVMVGKVVGVPLQGLPAVASPNTDERTKLIATSRMLGSIGESSALALYTVGMIFLNLRTTLLVSAIIIGILAPIFMSMAGLTVKERIPPSIEKPNMLDGFKFLFKNKPFLMLILANLLTFFRNLVTASHIYVVSFVFNSPGSVILFGLPGAISGMIGMILAPWLKKKFEAKQIFIGAIIYHSLALTLVWIVGPVHLLVTAGLLFIAMFAVGILNMVPTLMAADCLDYWEYKTGLRQEGITFSLMGLRSKVSSAFRDFTLTFLFAFFLFNSTDTSVVKNALTTQFAYTTGGLFLILTIIPAVTNLVSIIPMFFYDLTGKRLTEIRNELALRRAEKAGAATEGGAVI